MFAMPAPEKMEVNNPIRVPRKDQEALEAICQWIFDHTGIYYYQKKIKILYSRLQSLCWQTGIQSLQELYDTLQQPGSEWLAAEVARVVATNYTFFFREKETFDFLQNYIFPSLMNQPTWRIWSAAASSGEEAFSVAMQLSEMLGQDQALQRAAILGTDISYPMIEQAEQGLFSEEKIEMLPKVILYKYFEAADSGTWRISPKIKQMCTFRRLNLVSYPWPFRQPFHLILCRNIFYYFDKAKQVELIEHLYDVTAPGGWLLTSVTETFHSTPLRWQRIATGIWRKSL